MIGDQAQGGLGHRVDHARSDQVDHIAGVWVRRVLDRRRCPQRPLRPGAGGAQRGPARRGEHLLVVLVGETGVRDRRASAQPGRLAGPDLVQPGVDLGIDPGHEEGGDRPDRRQVMAGPPGAFHPVEEGVHDRVVARQGEDQRDVDADALGQARGDRGQSLPGGRDLDEQVGPVDQPPQRPRLGDRGLGVMREPRVDLDRHPAIHAVGRVVDRPQDVTGPAHVEGGQRPQRLPGIDAAGGQVPQLRVIGVAAGDRLGEDAGIGRHPHHMITGGKIGQAAGHQPFPAQVIQPDRDSGLAQCP